MFNQGVCFDVTTMYNAVADAGILVAPFPPLSTVCETRTTVATTVLYGT